MISVDGLVNSQTFFSLSTEVPLATNTSKDTKLPELTEEMEAIYHDAISSEWYRQIIEIDGVNIAGKDIKTLRKSNLVNDSIIDFYLAAICRRNSQDTSFPRCYVFNNFFTNKFKNHGFSSIRRWTKNVDIFGYDLIFIPVHLPGHWCLATIDINNKTICMYDSLGKDRDDILKLFPKYLELEHKDKKNTEFDASNFKIINVKEIPLQENAEDCGVFTLKYAEYLSRKAKFTFNQQDMPYYRKRMVYEIVKNIVIHP